MNIGILTWGSHGDIRPFLALADGLQAAGHQVHLVITCFNAAEFADPVSVAGVRITVLRPVALSREKEQEIGQIVYQTRDPMQQAATILRLWFAPAEAAMFDSAQTLCAQSDLLIGHYFMHPLQIAAEMARKPYVSVMLTHAGVPTQFSHPLANLGTWGNRALWWLTRFAINRALLAFPNRLRTRLGLAPARDMVSDIWLSPVLSLVAVSPQICPQQPDWDASIRVTGFLDRPHDATEGQLPEALAAFLAAGEAPIYMTYGSWMSRDLHGQREAIAMLHKAAQLAQCRAIIQCHDWEACGFQSDHQVLFVAMAPHQQIFPHCFGVLHHGGAGTTQSVTLAGKPSIVVANLGEQEHWGDELKRLGLAHAPLKRRSATAERIAQRIRRLRAAPQMAARAREVSQAMQAENGVAAAVAAINALNADRGLSPPGGWSHLP